MIVMKEDELEVEQKLEGKYEVMVEVLMVEVQFVEVDMKVVMMKEVVNCYGGCGGVYFRGGGVNSGSGVCGSGYESFGGERSGQWLWRCGGFCGGGWMCIVVVGSG